MEEYSRRREGALGCGKKIPGSFYWKVTVAISCGLFWKRIRSG
jgi:hypothetical protein